MSSLESCFCTLKKPVILHAFCSKKLIASSVCCLRGIQTYHTADLTLPGEMFLKNHGLWEAMIKYRIWNKMPV